MEAIAFASSEPKLATDEPLALNGPHWEQFKLSDGALVRKLKTDVDALKGSQTHMQQLLLAEAAIEHNLTLLTSDKCLANVVQAHGGDAVVFSGQDQVI